MKNLQLPAIPNCGGLLHYEDHVTFVVPYHQKQEFIDRAGTELIALPAIITTKFPAEHIALVEKPTATSVSRRMVGLSVSLDPDSPINKLYELGKEKGKLAVRQHAAYSVDPAIDFAQIRRSLELRGVNFMTPVLEYSDPGGAMLRQMFVACKVPYGPFIEIIQRTPDPKTGLPFEGFNADQIDRLYHFYDAYSLELLKKA